MQDLILFGTDSNGTMNKVGHEVAYEVLVDLRIRVDCHESLLGQDVVEARSPLPWSQASNCGAVVNHECHSASMHEGVQRVHGLDDTLIDDLWVRVSLPSEDLNLQHCKTGEIDNHYWFKQGIILSYVSMQQEERNLTWAIISET